VHSYGNVPAVANVREADVLDVVPIDCGAPLDEKMTLWGMAPIVHVTVPPTATVTDGTVKVFVVVPTAAASGPLVGPVTAIAAVALALAPSRVSAAVMVVDPGAMGVTVPVPFTIAVPAAAVVKVNPVAPAIAFPRASRADACSATFAPIASDGAAGESATVAIFCATVKLTVAVAAALAAAMVTEPSPTAVTVAEVPVPLTVATAALLDV